MPSVADHISVVFADHDSVAGIAIAVLSIQLAACCCVGCLFTAVSKRRSFRAKTSRIIWTTVIAGASLAAILAFSGFPAFFLPGLFTFTSWGAIIVLWLLEVIVITVAQVHVGRKLLGLQPTFVAPPEIDLEQESARSGGRFDSQSVIEVESVTSLGEQSVREAESTVSKRDSHSAREVDSVSTAPEYSVQEGVEAPEGERTKPTAWSWPAPLPFTSRQLALLTLLNAVLVIFFFDICITTHPVGVSTMITRLMRGSACPPDKGVCYAYVTAAQDMRTTAIYNFAATVRVASLEAVLNFSTVQVSKMSGNNTGFPYPVATYCFTMPSGEPHHSVQCHADLLNLEPDTIYRVELQAPLAGSPEDSSLGRIHFSTAPTTGRVRYGAGGDYSVKHGPVLLRRAASYFDEPLHAFLLNGDLSYANGLRACSSRWDDAIRSYVAGLSTEVTFADGTTGLHTPQLLTSIGNHETGMSFNANRARMLPSYIALFPHKVGLVDLSYEAAVTKWPSYHTHSLSDFALIAILDPGVLEGNWPTPNGVQERWLEAELSAARDAGQTQLSAAAHYSMFPSKMQYMMQSNRDAMRSAWLPLFTRYGVRMVHDAHYHNLKVSKAMVNLTVVGNSNSTEGTVYLGDGALGITSRRLRPHELEQDFMETSDDVAHVYVMQLDADRTNAYALPGDPDAEPLVTISRSFLSAQ